MEGALRYVRKQAPLEFEQARKPQSYASPKLQPIELLTERGEF